MQKKGVSFMGSQIVVWILLLASFAILIWVWWQWNAAQIINEESCRDSVTFRASLGEGLGHLTGDATTDAGKEIMPLKCKTEKVCISTGLWDSCSGISGEKREVSSDEDKIYGDILSIFAEEMYNCFSIYGEGKLNFMPGKDFTHNYCFICKHIEFSENVRKILKEMKREEIPFVHVLNFFENNNLPNSETKTYLQKFYGVKTTSDFVATKGVDKEKFEEKKQIALNSKFNIDEPLFINIVLVKKGNLLSKVLGGLGAGIGAVIGWSIGGPVGAGIGGGSLGVWAFSVVYNDAFAFSGGYFNEQGMKDLGCNTIETFFG